MQGSRQGTRSTIGGPGTLDATPLVLLVRVKRVGRQPRRRLGSGQSLVEFALVVPVLLLMVGGVVQLGVIFAAKNSLVQAARDTARWAATQTYLPTLSCISAATATPPQPLTQADATASSSSLIGYQGGMWTAGIDPVIHVGNSFTRGNFTWYSDNEALPASLPNAEGVEVVWSSSGNCPTTDNTVVAYVTVRLTHSVPLFLPGLGLVPGAICSDRSGCYLPTSATAMFRMEPPPP